MTTRGVFRLSSYRSQELRGDGVPINDVWYLDKLQQKGYTIGGSNPSNEATSNYNQLNYDTDTRTNAANSPLATMGASGTASPSTGYTYGGKPTGSSPNYYSSVSKFDFTTQTHTALPGTNYNEGNIGNGKWQGASCGSQTHGYLCGGRGPGEGGGYSRMDRMTYATETLERLPSSNMPSPGQEYNSSASGDGNTAGYWVGGANGSGSHVRKFTYSNNSWSSLPNLPGANPLNRAQKAGQASSDTGTYVVGGSNPYSTRIQKITFATGNNAIVANSTVPTPAGRIRLTGTGNVSTGYFAGGSETSVVEKMNFSTNSTSRIPAMDLAQGVRDLGSCSAAEDNRVAPVPVRWVDNEVETQSNHGYFGMGFPSSGNGDFKRLDFVTETVSSNYQFYTPGRQQFAVGSSLTHGYNLAGAYQGGAKSNVYKWDYATNSGSENPSRLNRTRRQSNSSSTRTHGYVVGGYSDYPTPDGTKTDISKYSFTTDTSLGNITGNLPTTNQAGMGMGTQEVGYHSQGSGTYVWKLNYSSDTVSTLSGRLPVYRYEMTPSTMANATTGYFVGGSQGPGAKSSTDKVDFSTDTISAGANLSNNAQRGQATSNTEVGYVMLGWNAPGPAGGTAVSQEMNKYDFATDTVTAKGALFNHQPNTYSTALSVRMNNQSGLIPASPTATPTPSQALDSSVTAPDAGYNMKGNTPGGLTSRISKIAFATDTKSNPGNMPTPGEHSTDFSSLTAAYSNTGKQGPANYTSSAQKVTYSTDSASSVPGGQTQNYQRQTAKCATMTHGYIVGGLMPSSPISNFNKMTFSNESYSLLPATMTGNFSSPSVNNFMAGFNSSTAGYWAGGEGPGNPQGTSSVVKLTFATETSTANPGNLPTLLKESASLGNGEVAGYTLSGAAPSYPGNHISYTSKMLYSTETFSIVPGAYWNPIRYRMTSFSSFNAGYSGMGSESNDAFSKMPWSTETWSPIPGNFPSGSSNTRDTGGGTSAKSNVGGKPMVPVVL